jgi:RHH-type transcriptional regulator, proline utilization regulon repressor / proline dehydrogenase / delta 1-pyrroline-5-carboxylate dehydrogenase
VGRWLVGPVGAAAVPAARAGQPVLNPATGAIVGQVVHATADEVAGAVAVAVPWQAPPQDRAAVLNRAADLYEEAFGAIFALLAREAGKTLADAVAELREAVDFLRYYASGAVALAAPARGVFACISPWNFPLAIFTGQIAAALAAGNGVIAKPAEQTPLIAALAVELLHKAGVPVAALQFLPGDGATVGAALSSRPGIAGIAFTGSTETAKLIRAAMAAHLSPTAPLIAETGGLNAMVVDSTALPEQAVRDVIASSFQSAGQRCSALRCLYLQEDVAPHVEAMLLAAMDDLAMGDPWDLATDIGPVIDAEAQAGIVDYISAARAEGRVMKSMVAPAQGTFVGPTVIRVKGIADMPREIFGPVLHIAHFKARDLTRVIDDINATGYGLTFGLHTRIDDRVQHVVERLRVGNAYVNRNQIGAVVGSQPFGGEGLSGTGPKAGGPHYLARFTTQGVALAVDEGVVTTEAVVLAALRRVQPDPRPVAAINLPGPTGESNRLSSYQHLPLICLGPSVAAARAQAVAVRAFGGLAVEAPGLAAEALARLPVSGAVWWGGDDVGRAYALALSQRQGAILPLVGTPDAGHALMERHVCIDTTASGGNAELLATVAD